MARGTGLVHVEKHFDRFNADVERGVKRLLGHTAGKVIAGAAAVPTDYKIDKVKRSGRASTVERSRTGYQIFIRWSDYRANWFQKGTRLKKGRLRRGRNADPPGPNRGVKPVRFMSKGLRSALPSFRAELERVLR